MYNYAENIKDITQKAYGGPLKKTGWPRNYLICMPLFIQEVI
jgi:hypothetical protein